MRKGPDDCYTTLLLFKSQKDELSQLAVAYGMPNSSFLRIIMTAGLTYFKQVPSDCFRAYADLVAVQPATSAISNHVNDAGAKFVKAIDSASADPGDITGSIYDVPCPWCEDVIDTLCERTLRPDDVVKCDHCDRPIDIKALADDGKVIIRRFNASK